MVDVNTCLHVPLTVILHVPLTVILNLLKESERERERETFLNNSMFIGLFCSWTYILFAQ
jgi:hypothetical protein